MKPKDKKLTYEQAKELKWFCKNVVGTRSEFYEALDTVHRFQTKIDNLQKTADMILKWCEDNGIKMLGEEEMRELKNKVSVE